MKAYSKKLLAYSAMVPAILHLSETKGQILYTNLDPDVVVGETDQAPDTLLINLDGDAVDDIQFSYKVFSSTSSFRDAREKIKKVSGTWAVERVFGEQPTALDYGATISAADTWYVCNPFGSMIARVSYNPSITSAAFPSYSGNFPNKTDMFLAVRKFDAPDYYYGWIRLSSKTTLFGPDGAIGVTVHDFALNLTPNEPITAGETGAGCNPPFPKMTHVLSPTKAKLRWMPVTNARTYQIRFRETGTVVWTTVNVDAIHQSKILTPLNCDADYEWQIRAKSDDMVNSVFSDMQTFSTGACRIGDFAEAMSDIQLYPNPATDIIHIDLAENINALVRIYDLAGKLMMAMEAGETHLITIDISGLPSGIYNAEISNAEFTRAVQFIQQ